MSGFLAAKCSTFFSCLFLVCVLFGADQAACGGLLELPAAVYNSKVLVRTEQHKLKFVIKLSGAADSGEILCKSITMSDHIIFWSSRDTLLL